MKEFITGYFDAMNKVGFFEMLLYCVPVVILGFALVAMVVTVCVDVDTCVRGEQPTTFREALSINQYKVYHLLALIYFVPVWIVEGLIIVAILGLKYLLTRPISRPRMGGGGE